MKIHFASQSTLEIETNGKEVISTETVDKLITELGLLRKAMTPEIPKNLPDGDYTNQLVDPCWALPLHPASEEKILAIRHDGYGWLLFFLPAHEAQKLGNGLLAKPPHSSSSQHVPKNRRH